MKELKVLQESINSIELNPEAPEAFWGFLLQLEELVKESKESYKEELRERLQGEKTYQLGRLRFTSSPRYSKVINEEVLAEEFKKTEVKPNTQAINKYFKEHKEYPEGVSEVLAGETERVTITKRTPEEEKALKEKNREEYEKSLKRPTQGFMDLFKSE